MTCEEANKLWVDTDREMTGDGRGVESPRKWRALPATRSPCPPGTHIGYLLLQVKSIITNIILIHCDVNFTSCTTIICFLEHVKFDFGTLTALGKERYICIHYEVIYMQFCMRKSTHKIKFHVQMSCILFFPAIEIQSKTAASVHLVI